MSKCLNYIVADLGGTRVRGGSLGLQLGLRLNLRLDI